ncbi:MAG: hypothetical protein QOC56_550 [Alphaproteobacteria bacterium]|jgi:uncharacterized membrane protein YhaH (DUF805 family)|nr:hypothetical protein [Alphaproteobacteria bacterium]
MNFPQAIEAGFRNYVNSRGRASRSEYWYWTLFALMVAIVSTVADATLFPANPWTPVATITGLALFLPGLAISIRRLHDIDKSGYWVLIALTIVGVLLLIYWAVTPGTEGDNDFGPDPLAVPARAPA